jgi:hypothetical protein
VLPPLPQGIIMDAPITLTGGRKTPAESGAPRCGSAGAGAAAALAALAAVALLL